METRRLVTAGVLLGIFLAAVDGTVVTVAMPTVVASLGGLSLYSWVFTGYMLFTAATIPLFGRLDAAIGWSERGAVPDHLSFSRCGRV